LLFLKRGIYYHAFFMPVFSSHTLLVFVLLSVSLSANNTTSQAQTVNKGYSRFADTNLYRWRVIQTPPAEFNGTYVFVDYLRGLYDLQGNRIWSLPNIDTIVDDNTIIRDLKATSAGTITFLTYKGAYEIDYNANILWAAPNDGKVSGGTTENYHHEFTRLKNGNYMLTGTETIKKLTASTDTLLVQYETLVEYDSKGAIVWSWKGSEHLPDSLVFKKGMDRGHNTSMHLNSFYVDEKAGRIYLGYRDLSAVVVISYPSGNILNIYSGQQAQGFRFHSQHSCRIDKKGNLYMYSNNNAGKHERKEDNCISSVGSFKIEGNKLTKQWEYTCDIDSLAATCTNSGGSIEQIEGTDKYLVSMGSVHRNFIIDSKGKIYWNVLTEMKNGDGKWQPAGTYRISYVNAKQLERLQQKVKKP
jgi:hypothetical protein